MKQKINTFKTQNYPIEKLKTHPRNYRHHPEDQIEHIVQSITENGFYRNIVVAKDGTILAGHGVFLAVKKLGMKTVPVYQLDVEPDSVKALKVITGDNEIGHLGEVDDRQLTELLQDINNMDADGLLGTGYDEMMLSNLLYITRPADEIKTKDVAKEYVGMPDYDEGGDETKLVVKFFNNDDREAFCNEVLKGHWLRRTGKAWSAFWGKSEENDLKAIKFEPKKQAKQAEEGDK